MENEEIKQTTATVQIKDKVYLTLSEACEYYNISINRMRALTNDSKSVLWVSNRRLINREQFTEELKELQKQKRKENHYGKNRKQRKSTKQSKA